jgi:DNA polymerase-3 subunit epsilon
LLFLGSAARNRPARMSQFSFDFDAPKAPVPAPPPRPKAPPVAELAPEQMAQRLDAHPDYRVLRRLVPVLDHGAAPANAPAGVQRVLVLDTETTGLSHASDKIIELAMLLVQVDAATGQPFGPVETFEGFEDPGMPIPEVAKQVTGISDDMVRGQRLDDAQVQALIDRADLVVAHNAGFDRPFVEARLPVFAGKAWGCSFLGIDWKKEGSGSAKLEFLASERGWFYDAHRAQVDCHALLQVLAAPLAGGQTGLARLLAGADQTRYKLRATGAPFESKDKLKARGYRWDGEGRVWWCSLASDALLNAECAWLRAEVYGQRSARVQLEAMDSWVQFSSRSGLLTERAV